MSCVELYFTDSDEEDSAYNVAVKRIQIRDKTNPLELPNNLFHKYFRLNKEAFRLLLIKIEEKLKPSTRSCSVTPMIKLAATLRFFAEGGYQTGTGNEFIAGLAQSTFSKILSQVCDVLLEQICPEYIKFQSDPQVALFQLLQSSIRPYHNIWTLHVCRPMTIGASQIPRSGFFLNYDSYKFWHLCRIHKEHKQSTTFPIIHLFTVLALLGLILFKYIN